MRKYTYTFKRILLHFIRPIIEKSHFINGIARAKLYRAIGYKNIGEDVWIGKDVYLDELHPEGIVIGKNSTIMMGAVLLTHFYDTRKKMRHNGTIKIGENVFIGCNIIISKPIEIEDNVIVGACSVVTKNLSGNAVHAGNPARKIIDR